MARPKASGREKGAERKPDEGTNASLRGDGAILAVLILVVCGVTAVTHWPALSAKAYSFDDSQYLLKNPLVQNPSWESARRFLAEVLEPSTVGGYYQPLAMISLMLDHAVGGRPDYLRPFHRTSLALHVVNVALVILLLYLLFQRVWPAAMVGLLFGVHPLTVEPIPWIGERKTVLSTFFALVCLILYVFYARYAKSPQSGAAAHTGPNPTLVQPKAKKWPLYAGCLVAFVLALMSKPTTTPLPVLLLLLDYWPLRRLGRRSLIEKAPFFLVAGVSAVVTIISQARTASVTLPGERPGGWVPFTLCHNIVFYLHKIAWPANLSSHYPFPEPLSWGHPMVRAGVIGTVVLLAVLLVSWRRTRVLVTSWAFFFTAIFPTLGVIGFTDVIASDKFAYLPSVGLMLALAWWLGRLWGPEAAEPPRAGARAGLIVAVLALAALEVRATRRYLAVWQDTDRFWTHMMALAPGASTLYSNYAGFLIEEGRWDEAKKHCEDALARNQENYAAHNALGSILIHQRRAKDALPHFHQALNIRPDDYIIHVNLASALTQLERHAEAMTHYGEALRLQPGSPEVYFNLAGALVKQGRTDEAIAHYVEATRRNPRWPQPLNRLGILFASLGRLDEALLQFDEALRRKPDWAEVHKNLGVTLAQLGRVDEAIVHYQAALQIDPDMADVHFNLANALAVRGQDADAIGHYREAARLQPGDAQTHGNLARALVKGRQLDAAIAEFAVALRLKPDWAEGHNDLGAILASADRLDEALIHFAEAVRLRPDWEEARRNLATARSEMQMRDPSLKK